MLRQLVRDESGMTMGLAVITMVLIGVMGAGLLVFVQRDLDSVVENNQGQRAFEMAEAGVQAAREQLHHDSIPSHYDGGTDDIRWSKFYSGGPGMTLTDLDGSPATADSVHVQIEYRFDTTEPIHTFVVVSTGTYGDARRKIEAVLRRTGAIRGVPPAYYTRNNLQISGNITSTGLSFFAQKNANVSGSIDFGTVNDNMKKWAETGDSLSYPNVFNNTARSSALPGVAVGGVLTLGAGTQVSEQVQKGIRSFDKDTTPHVVPHYYQSTLPPAEKIAFPFSITSLSNDLEILRQRAIQLEQQNPSVDYYKDNLPNGTHYIDSWPTDADYGTVYFYKFPTYHTGNRVVWNVILPCTDASRKGVIVVENGDFEFAGNKGGFNGTVLVYGAKDLTTSDPDDYIADQGNFHTSGTSCMTGYATSTGDMFLSGKYSAQNIPGLNELPIFIGTMQHASWRELYE